jgi:hypothetical protein
MPDQVHEARKAWTMPINRQPIRYGGKSDSIASIAGFSRWGAMLAVVVLLDGCAQTTLTAGSDLGTSGQKAAQAMKQATVLSDDQLTGLRQAMTFHNGYVAAKAGTKPDIATAAAVADLEATVATQSKFLDSLAATYAALAGLASYDSAGKFNTAFGGLETDTNSFIKALDPKSPGLAKTSTNVAQQVGGFLVRQFQRQQVIEASKQIRIPLQAAIDTMTQRKLVYETNLHIYVVENGKALSDLYRAHLLSCAPVLDGMGAIIGEKSVPDVDQLINRDKALATGMQPLCDPEQVMPKLEARLTSNYESSLKALNALLPLHAKLEAGEPLDLSTLIDLVNQIKPLVQLRKS